MRVSQVFSFKISSGGKRAYEHEAKDVRSLSAEQATRALISPQEEQAWFAAVKHVASLKPPSPRFGD